MEKALAISRISFFVIASISSAVIAYSQYEIAQAGKVQAVALAMSSKSPVHFSATDIHKLLNFPESSIKQLYLNKYDGGTSNN